MKFFSLRVLVTLNHNLLNEFPRAIKIFLTNVYLLLILNYHFIPFKDVTLIGIKHYL